jgi:hypothetical protein
MAGLMQGTPVMVWDNILRGTQINCPHIDRSCTSRFMADRKLGVSENVTASAATINFVTGNAIAPSGDTASRALTITVMVDRPDPENRVFSRPDDPLDWTTAHRHEILEDIYTVMLGNPRLGTSYQPPTRFKDWMYLIGSAFEYAAAVYREDAIAHGANTDIPEVTFSKLFLAQDDDDEQSSDLATTLNALLELQVNGLPTEFTAAKLTEILNNRNEQRSNQELARVALLREFLFPDRINFPTEVVTAVTTGKRLKRHLGEPVVHHPDDEETPSRALTLKEVPKPPKQPQATARYFVDISGCEPQPKQQPDPIHSHEPAGDDDANAMPF